MVKLFTVERANELIPAVNHHMTELQRDLEDLKGVHAQQASLPSGSIEARNANREMAFLTTSIQGSQRELARLGVEVRDVERGVVAFPARIGAEVVDLVWRQGSDAVTHYRRLTGDETPQPLPQAEPLTNEKSPSA